MREQIPVFLEAGGGSGRHQGARAVELEPHRSDLSALADQALLGSCHVAEV